MNVLEKILEEIEKTENEYCHKEHSPMFCMGACSMAADLKEIIRSHMDDIRNSEWTSVEESLPKAKDKVLVTVKHSSWIADFDSKWVSEKEKTYHPETRSAYIGYINDDDIWIFIDEEGQENICDKAFGRNLGSVYDVVTHWKPLPEPYKPKETTTAGREHIMSRFTEVK